MERLLSHVVQLKDMLHKSINEHDTVRSMLWDLKFANCFSWLTIVNNTVQVLGEKRGSAFTKEVHVLHKVEW